MEEPPKLAKYDGNADSDEHMQHVNDLLNYFSIDDTYKFKLFALNLIRMTEMWFNGFSHGSITSWINFSERSSARFTTQNR